MVKNYDMIPSTTLPQKTNSNLSNECRKQSWCFTQRPKCHTRNEIPRSQRHLPSKATFSSSRQNKFQTTDDTITLEDIEKEDTSNTLEEKVTTNISNKAMVGNHIDEQTSVAKNEEVHASLKVTEDYVAMEKLSTFKNSSEIHRNNYIVSFNSQEITSKYIKESNRKDSNWPRKQNHLHTNACKSKVNQHAQIKRKRDKSSMPFCHEFRSEFINGLKNSNMSRAKVANSSYVIRSKKEDYHKGKKYKGKKNPSRNIVKGYKTSRANKVSAGESSSDEKCVMINEATKENRTRDQKMVTIQDRKNKRVKEAEKRSNEVQRRGEEKQLVEIDRERKESERLQYIQLKRQREGKIKVQRAQLEKEKQHLILEQQRLEIEKEEKIAEEKREAKIVEEFQSLELERRERSKLISVAEYKLKMFEREKERQRQKQLESICFEDKTEKKATKERKHRSLYKIATKKDEDFQINKRQVDESLEKQRAYYRCKQNQEMLKLLMHTKINLKTTNSSTFSYFLNIPRKVWELPIDWRKKPKYKPGGRAILL